MFIFSSTNGFRCAIHAVVTFPLFDVFIMLVIIASSIALAAEDPVSADSEWNKKLTYFDYGFTCVFGIEVLLKVRPRPFSRFRGEEKDKNDLSFRSLTTASFCIPARTSGSCGTSWTCWSCPAPSPPSPWTCCKLLRNSDRKSRKKGARSPKSLCTLADQWIGHRRLLSIADGDN